MRLVDQAALLTLGRLVERTTGVLTGIVLVRLLTKDDYGTFLQVALVGTLVATIVLLGLPQSLFYFVPLEAPERRKNLLVQTTVLAGILLLPAAALVGACESAIATVLHNPQLASLGLILAAYVLLYALDRLTESTLVAIGEARRASVMTMTSSTLVLLAILGPAWAGWRVRGIYGCLLAVYAARLLYLLWVIQRLGGTIHAPWPRMDYVRRQFKFSLPLGLAGISGQYNRQIDGIVVSSLFVPAVYAVYARGAFELPLIDLLPYTLATVILPRLVELWKESRREEFGALWNRAIQVSSLLVFPAFAYTIRYATEFIVVLFTEAYRGAIPVFRIYLLALPFRLTSYGALLQAVGAPRVILHASLVGALLNGVIAIVLCKLLGPSGAAAGYVSSQILQVVYLLDAIRRIAGIPWRSLLPWLRLARAGFVVLIALGITEPLGSFFVGPLLRLAVTGPLFLSLCLVGYAWTGLIGPEERDLFRRWLGLGIAFVVPRGRGRSAERVIARHNSDAV